MIQFRRLVDHVIKTLDIKRGPATFVLASLYKKKAEQQVTNGDSKQVVDKAIQLIDNDSPSSRQNMLREAERQLAEKRNKKSKSNNQGSDSDDDQ